MHRRHHLRRRLLQGGQTGGGQAGAAQDLEDSLPHPGPGLGQQARSSERPRRLEDRVSARTQRARLDLPLAHPADVCDHR